MKHLHSLFQKEEYIIHLHSVYTDPIGDKTTYYDKFKTHKKGKL